ncbi:hypothetical protein GGI05_002031, partial [Coemansia sp. RSA 2603]
MDNDVSSQCSEDSFVTADGEEQAVPDEARVEEVMATTPSNAMVTEATPELTEAVMADSNEGELSVNMDTEMIPQGEKHALSRDEESDSVKKMRLRALSIFVVGHMNAD